MVFTAQSGRESQVGYPKFRFFFFFFIFIFNTGISFCDFITFLFLLVFYLFLMHNLVILTMVLLLECFCR